MSYGTAIQEAEFWKNQVEGLILQVALIEGDEAHELRHKGRNLLMAASYPQDLRSLRELAVAIADLQKRIAEFIRAVAESVASSA